MRRQRRRRKFLRELRKINIDIPKKTEKKVDEVDEMISRLELTGNLEKLL